MKVIHRYQGFATREEAMRYKKEHGGALCHAQNKGLRKEDYQDMVTYGLNENKYPYAVAWNEIYD